MIEQLTIRPATFADAQAVANVFVVARTECFTFLDTVYDLPFFVGLFGEKIIPKGNVWIAELDREVVGFVEVIDTELDRIYVLPAWHGKGVGQILLDKAKELSPDGLWLWVFQKNAQARRFYEKHGFNLDHKTNGQDNMEKEPDARYVWRS